MRCLLSPVLLLCLVAGSAQAQKFVWGAKIGAPATSVLTAGGGYSASTTPFTIGPTGELLLPFGVGLEADFLYKRFTFQRPALGAATAGVNGNSWEIPLLLKVRPPGGVIVHPYFDGGFSFRTLQGLSQFGSAAVSGDPAELRNNSSRGLVLGAGFELRIPFVRLSPELRFTHWGSKAFQSTDGSLASRQNQLDVLLGVTF